MQSAASTGGSSKKEIKCHHKRLSGDTFIKTKYY
jgi:hypothetical protein